MNPHLSSQQISERVLGERNADVERHIHGCPACHREVTRLGIALSQFRTSAHQWSSQQLGGDFQIKDGLKKAGSWITFNRLCWAFVLATICIVVGVSVPRERNQQIVTEVGVTDAILLSRIDTELSRAVPCPMEPLAQLVAWDGSTREVGSAERGEIRQR